MNQQTLTIGQLAASAGVGVETVRFYQRKGLVHEPPRPLGGIRRYPVDTAARIHFIKAAQKLGFSLAEVRELLDFEVGGGCREIKVLAEEKRRAIRQRIADLKRLDATLSGLLRRCATTRGRVRCPIVAALEESS